MIEELSEKKEVVYVSTPKNVDTKPIKFTINTILWILAVIILLAIISTYFVEELPDFVLDIRNVSIQVLFVFLGGTALGELFKIISINRARACDDYINAKNHAKKELSKITGEQKKYIQKYCLSVAESQYIIARNAILDGAKIPYDDFEKKYFTLSKKEILKQYPDCNLSKKQFFAIKAANAVKKQVYDPDFLQSVVVEEIALVPSKRFNTKKKNFTNTIFSFILGGIGTLFAVGIAEQLIFSFSLQVFFSAVIKIVTIIITVIFKVNFGHNLVMIDEINRFSLQAQEANNFITWYENKIKTGE